MRKIKKMLDKYVPAKRMTYVKKASPKKYALVGRQKKGLQSRPGRPPKTPKHSGRGWR